MALKETTYVVDQPGDDNGKTFVITRMNAFDADKWGRRVLQAAIGSGANIPQIAEGSGLAGVALAGINVFAGIDPEKADALLGQLMDCVRIHVNPLRPESLRKLHASDIEEIGTVSRLHAEAFKLHVDFFTGVAPLFSLLAGAMKPPENIGTTPEQ